MNKLLFGIGPHLKNSWFEYQASKKRAGACVPAGAWPDEESVA